MSNQQPVIEQPAIDRILRLPEVKTRVGLGTTAIYDKMKKGVFPKQVKQGRLSGWYESEIQAYIMALDATRATNDDYHAQAA